jgi:hypothetical protein
MESPKGPEVSKIARARGGAHPTWTFISTPTDFLLQLYTIRSVQGLKAPVDASEANLNAFYEMRPHTIQIKLNVSYHPGCQA